MVAACTQAFSTGYRRRSPGAVFFGRFPLSGGAVPEPLGHVPLSGRRILFVFPAAFITVFSFGLSFGILGTGFYPRFLPLGLGVVMATRAPCREERE